MNENVRDWVLAIAAIIGVVVLILLIVALIFLFYGAIFGAIGAGAYMAFKFLVSLIP